VHEPIALLHGRDGVAEEFEDLLLLGRPVRSDRRLAAARQFSTSHEAF